MQLRPRIDLLYGSHQPASRWACTHRCIVNVRLKIDRGGRFSCRTKFPLLSSVNRQIGFTIFFTIASLFLWMNSYRFEPDSIQRLTSIVLIVRSLGWRISLLSLGIFWDLLRFRFNSIRILNQRFHNIILLLFFFFFFFLSFLQFLIVYKFEIFY